jgi:hypothetical protein
MKTKNHELNEVWGELCDIFIPTFKIDKRTINRLGKLGFIVYQHKGHPKMYFYIDGVKQCVILSSTPSDNYASRQTLRQIRRIYEKKTRLDAHKRER